MSLKQEVGTALIIFAFIVAIIIVVGMAQPDQPIHNAPLSALHDPGVVIETAQKTQETETEALPQKTTTTASKPKEKAKTTNPVVKKEPTPTPIVLPPEPRRRSRAS